MGPQTGIRIDQEILAGLRGVPAFFARPVQIFRTYQLANLRPDLVAGLTVAMIALPQAIAYALIAELPPQMGLYSAIVGSIIGALWGSSDQLQTGPSNAASMVVLSVLIAVALPGTPEYLVAAGLLAVMAGLIRLAAGLARLGILVNFVSDSVVVGFTAGAGLLILANQLRHLMRLPVPSTVQLWDTLSNVVRHAGEVHWISLALGLSVTLLIVAFRRWSPRLPGPAIAMVAASTLVGILGADHLGVRTIGELPRGLPALTVPPFDMTLVAQLGAGAVAVAAIGLVEATSIARAIASQTRQRLDSNQEFVGQGLANIACGFLSGYPCSGSLARTAANFQAGARSPIASVFVGIFVLIAMLALAPLTRHLPLAALSGVILIVAQGLINHREIRRIWRSANADRSIMAVTFVATLMLPLQYAVFVGILMSLGHYLIKTSMPRVRAVVPDDAFRHFVHQPDKPDCPQLGVIEVLGDLYFGAVSHVEQSIARNLLRNPSQRFLLLRMHSVETCDISGIHALESLTETYREQGGDVFFVRVQGPVERVMRSTGFLERLGEDHLLTGDEAMDHLFYRVLDPAICIYECPVRVFAECQNLPKHHVAEELHFPCDMYLDDVPYVTPLALWKALRGPSPPLVIDVRAPGEFFRGRIRQARSIPLPLLLDGHAQVPRELEVVFVCRGGRRSSRAAALFRQRGYDRVSALQGGMAAWEANMLLVAVGEFDEMVNRGS
jgi:sulfate permease, SulP family